jgi:RNA recognition motif-containing protein
MRSHRFRGNIFVANLPPEFTDDELAEAFDSFGIVLSASIARDPTTGKRLRYGFVDIATERAAKLAVTAVNGTQIHGYTLDVRTSERPAPVRKPPHGNPPPHRASLRLTARANGEAEDAVGEFKPRLPRKPASFQVERRSLPRRV